MRSSLFLCLVAVTFSPAGTAQSPATASISGRVVSEDGRTVRAIVTLRFAVAQQHPAGLPRRAFSGADGSFILQRLSPGQYNLCVQAPDTETRTPDTPFLDTCEWAATSPPISLSSGQQLSGVMLPAPTGARLRVHIVDPQASLPAVAVGKAPAVLDPALQLVVTGPDRLIHHARFISQNGPRRDYELILPVNVPFGLTVRSSVAAIIDEGGKPVQADVPVQAAAGLAVTPRTFTLQKGGK